MTWRRVLGSLAIFLLGLGAGGTLLHLYASRSDTPTEAQRRALHLLDQPPIATSIGDNRIVEAVKRIAPAVVNIDTVGKVRPEDTGSGPLTSGMEVRGKGSGVILTPDGYIVTNNHVIDGANRTRVTMPDELVVLRASGRSGCPYRSCGREDRRAHPAGRAYGRLGPCAGRRVVDRGRQPARPRLNRDGGCDQRPEPQQPATGRRPEP